MRHLALWYCYIYYGMIRIQLCLGARESAYVRFKAAILVVMIETIWLVSIAALIKLLTGFDVVAWQPIVFYTMTCICIFGFNRLCLSVGLQGGIITDMFCDWPTSKRTRWDLGVIIFVAGTLAGSIYLAHVFRESGLHFNWS